MSFSGEIAAFIKSFASVFDVTGAAKQMLSASIADGVDAGVKRATRNAVPLVTLGVLFAVGLFLLAWGVSSALDAFLHVPGVGFALTGLLLLLIAVVYSQTAR